MKINNVTCELGKKTVKWALLLCLLIFMPLSMSAQAIDEEEDDDEPDEEDEITVVDQNGDEEVIEFPEAMTYDLDSLLNLYMSQTYLDEQDCNMKDVNPEYSKEEYVDRLYRMPCVMEMAYNDVVQKFIDRYSGRLRRSEGRYSHDSAVRRTRHRRPSTSPFQCRWPCRRCEILFRSQRYNSRTYTSDRLRRSVQR